MSRSVALGAALVLLALAAVVLYRRGPAEAEHASTAAASVGAQGPEAVALAATGAGTHAEPRRSEVTVDSFSDGPLGERLLGREPVVLDVRIVDRDGVAIPGAWSNASAARSFPVPEGVGGVADIEGLDDVFYDTESGMLSVDRFSPGVSVDGRPDLQRHRFQLALPYDLDLTVGAPGLLGTRIEVPVATVHRELEIVLGRKPLIRGRLVDAKGEPFGRGEVRYRTLGRDERVLATRSGRERVGADGEFELELPVTGPVELELCDRSSSRARVLRLDLRPDDLHVLGDLVVAGDASIDLQLLLPEGARIAGWRAIVTPVHEPQAWQPFERRIAGNGAARVRGLIAGDYVVTISTPFGPAGAVTCRVEQSPARVELPLDLIELEFVLSGGAPDLATTRVQLHTRGGEGGEPLAVCTADSIVLMPVGAELDLVAVAPDESEYRGTLTWRRSAGRHRVLLQRVDGVERGRAGGGE